MFAVPGWSLPTTGPTEQVDTSSSTSKKNKKRKKDHATGANNVDVTPAGAARIKERRLAAEREEKKAAAAATGVTVNAENVDKLWRTVIAGEEDKGGKKRKRSGEKPAQQEQNEKEDGAEEAPRRKKLKEKKKEKKATALAAAAAAAAGGAAGVPQSKPLLPEAGTTKLTPLQQKMRAKLTSARFRHINETLYTTPSASSFELFKQQPEMYSEYHAGFRQQVEVWPENPVDTFISDLRARAHIKFQKGYSKAINSTAVLPLPRDRETGICTVADLGCGDAKIAGAFNHGKGRKEMIKVLSYDLQASTPDVTIADIANLPLEKETVDVVIFCLALMGTNFLQFVEEAHRILKWRGELWVAEIKSRFNRKQEGNSNAVGRKKDHEEEGEEPEVEGEGAEKKGVPASYRNFVEALKKRGFVLKGGGVDEKNKMFVRMEFVKQPDTGGAKNDGEEEAPDWKKARMAKKKKPKFIEEDLKEEHIMKPCVYKLR
ncbi:methyltransferase-domain-containing protein [Sphaerosporella brunnea]|uniref:Ribosomal RNA-processing protein 8 n=1 Tax=Sphaerosporella brunnea TaxID=1250544 RepID=A0A5J5EWH5_9PEZI|nr:methyltransferase-domain-containing protein [Sphaerosporella brunnea]